VDFEVTKQIKESADENTAMVVKVAAARTWIGGEVLVPKISTFSSRGPSSYSPDFLKVCAYRVKNLINCQEQYVNMYSSSKIHYILFIFVT
jgi:hypothetical protein